MKILLVHNGSIARQFIESFFSGLEVGFMECADGEQALVVSREQQPDRVFADIQMAEADGLTPTRQIYGAFPEARVLIVSQFNGLHLRAAAREAGACGCILKENPMRAREFVQAQTQRKLVASE